MKLLDNILARFGFVNRDVVQRYGKRLYKAAQVDRMTSFMGNVNTQINQDIKTGNKIVRPRARDLKKNNDHAKNFDRRTKVNVIGPEGIKLQSVVKLPDGSLDEKANNLAEEKWRKWCERDFCTMSGTHHFTTITRQLWGSFKTDGEIFVRFIYPKSSVNPFGFSLELIDPEDVDESINKDLGNGKAIIMGIEFNEWYKPVAYHIKKRSLKASLQNYYHTGENETVRVPAEQILHVYDPDYIKQVRGISHYVHSLLRLKKVEAYEDASLDKAIGTSRTFGSLEEKLNDSQDYQSEDRDENDNPILNLQSGSIINAPHGKSLQIFDPDFPHEQFGPFIEVNVRAFYAAQGMDYAVATGHLSQANFSSLKSAEWMSKINF